MHCSKCHANANKRCPIRAIASHTITPCDRPVCTIPMCVHIDAAKHGCDYFDAVNKTCIYLKKLRLTIHACSLVVATTLKTPLYVMLCQNCQVIYSQFGLAIHQNDHQARHRFVEWAQNEIAVVPDLNKRILFSDGAHFWLNGYVNKQNCRIWSEANPQVYVETPLHPEKLTVWCALWAGGIIGPYFFKTDEGPNVTVNSDWYRAMITNVFIHELNNHDVQ
ncbi:putative transposable element [Trichonephila clavipes]|nr:putative transposable element [Trichonephila clavipes]